MKKSILYLLIVIIIQLTAVGLNGTSVTIGAGDEEACVPFDFEHNYSLQETIYLQSEFDFILSLQSITYYNNFPNWCLTNQPVQIWAGFVVQNDLFLDWIPSTSLTLVYDGVIDFPMGHEEITIPFIEGLWNSGNSNLVILTKSVNTNAQALGPLNFFGQTVGTNRSRYFSSDSINPDAANPPTTGYTLNGQYPKITLVSSDWVQAVELAATSVSGNQTPTIGIPDTYLVTIQNTGWQSPSGYTVKLFAGGQEVASVAGPPLSGGETTQVPITWTQSMPGINSLYARVDFADADSLNNQTPLKYIYVKPAGATTSPPAPDATARMPVDMFYQNSLFETIFPADNWYLTNVVDSCNISVIKFYNNFVSSSLLNMPTKIWLGVTNQTDLTSGWIPSDQLTLVYDGNVNYPAGTNRITINLQTPYFYNGGNLVMMVNRPMDTQFYNRGDMFACYESTANISRKAFHDYIVLNPANPPVSNFSLSNLVPFTEFLQLPVLGSLSGTVSNAQNQPVGGANVLMENTVFSMTTDSLGYYSFPSLSEGTYQFTVTKQGYQSQTQTVTITNGQNSILNFILQPEVLYVSVTGRIVNSHAQDMGIAGAHLTMTSSCIAQTTSDTEGYFTFDQILVNQAYSFQAEKEGYQTYTTTVPVTNLDINLGNVPVSEANLHPYNVQAVATAQNPGFNITWNPPYTGDGETIYYDSGDCTWGFGPYPEAPFDVAIRFTPEDLVAYAGMSLFSVKFYALYSNVTHKIRVWTGGSQGNSGNLLVDQLVNSITEDAWNTIDLDSPIFVSGNEELWIGINYSGTGNMPASCDDGPLHNWRGNLINTSGTWYTISFDPEWDYNWNIRGILNVDCTSSARIMVPLAYNPVYQNTGSVELRRNLNPTKANRESTGRNGNRSLIGYQVWSFEPYLEGNPELWRLVTPFPIMATAYFDSYPTPSLGSWSRKWAVRAVYTGDYLSAPAFSNPIFGGIPAGLIEGIVTNPLTNEHVQGVTITYTPTSNQSVSNSQGYYSLVLPVGSYHLTATKDGYIPYQQQNIAITDGDTTTVDINLSPIVANPDEPIFIKATILNSCYPNPFNQQTTVSFDIKEPVQTCIEIYNTKGQKIRSLTNALTKSGRYSIQWDGKDSKGKQVTGGVYLCKMTAGNYKSVRKLILLK